MTCQAHRLESSYVGFVMLTAIAAISLCACDAGRDDGVDCDAQPTGLRAATVTHGGCQALDDDDLVGLTIDRWCTFDTDMDCRLICDPSDEPRVSTCLVTQAEHLPDGEELCVMVVAALEITADGWLDVVGTRAAAILSAGPIHLAGMIAADGHERTPGPGGHAGGGPSHGGEGPGSGACGDTFDSAGGAGYGATGGNGGGESGGAGGPEYGNCTEAVLYGGSGGAGSHDVLAVGGGGGGALHLFSASAIEVGRDGVVSASGASGGDGYDGPSGGGGGGSGGTVILEAPTVSIAGAVRANGGDGGEGQDGRNGGDGGSGEDAAGEDGEEPFGGRNGGGGGGGAAGRVVLRSAAGGWLGTGEVSPLLPECFEAQLVCD